MTKSKSKPAESDLLLVVDAGGTKTAAWLVECSKAGANRILGRGRAAGANPLSVGFAESTRAISEAVALAHQEAGREGPVCRAVFSIAGSANAKVREQFIAWARDVKLARRMAIVSDVLPVLAAGTPNCCGVALIAGTGSVAFARAADGRVLLCGGWGYLLGDEGSGYAIGRAALQQALYALESLVAQQPLAQAASKAIGANSVLEMTKAIYQDPDPRGSIASVAPVVIAAADQGDIDAQAILDQAAADLARLVARAVPTLGALEGPFSLGLGGGVLVGSRRVQEQLQHNLNRMGLACAIKVVNEPLEGCIRLAAPEFAETLVLWHECDVEAQVNT